MKTLSFKQSTPLMLALKIGIVTIGIQKALQEFGEADSKPENLCAKSIFDKLSSDLDYQRSFYEAEPALPKVLTKIISAGYKNSVLDYALDDIYNVLFYSETITESLIELSKKYEQFSSKEICGVCFQREFLELLNRAKAEKAYTVTLEQIGDSFLNMYFKSSKTVLIKKATHSLVYKTLFQQLESSCNCNYNSTIKAGKLLYKVKQNTLVSFSLSLEDKAVLKIVFKGMK